MPSNSSNPVTSNLPSATLEELVLITNLLSDIQAIIATNDIQLVNSEDGAKISK